MSVPVLLYSTSRCTHLLFIQSDEDMAARCETVLNTTMAEMETYHIQKHEDFSTMAKEHLDGEIAFYEQVRLGVCLSFCACEVDRATIRSFIAFDPLEAALSSRNMMR